VAKAESGSGRPTKVSPTSTILTALTISLLLERVRLLL
jgi:hypothetical protein